MDSDVCQTTLDKIFLEIGQEAAITLMNQAKFAKYGTHTHTTTYSLTQTASSLAPSIGK